MKSASLPRMWYTLYDSKKKSEVKKDWEVLDFAFGRVERNAFYIYFYALYIIILDVKSKRRTRGYSNRGRSQTAQTRLLSSYI